MFDSRPIGLIDSGIGGFTVLRELQVRLPDENIIYLGDSLRMPYGELDNRDIISYANSDIRFLEARGVKAILLACNTVSSLVDVLTSRVPLFSIVEAGCMATIEAIRERTASQNPIEVGLIATRATVNNQVYPRVLASMTDQIVFVQQGTRTLASVINNYPNEIDLLRTHIHMAIDPLIEEKNIDTLLLGCTHYPIVRESIETLYPQLMIINPAIKEIEILQNKMQSDSEVIAPNLPQAGEKPKTVIYTTGSQADYKIFESMISYLNIDCTALRQGSLDLDTPRKNIN